jgi:hypothetical protein
VLAEKKEKQTTAIPKKTPAPVAKKSDTDKAIESTIKNAAVQILTGEILRRIKIRL